MFVGPNNGGKSTVIEALRALSQKNRAPSFTEGKRNKAADDRVSITAKLAAGHTHTLQTKTTGGSETEWTLSEGAEPLPVVFALPSRRYFNPYFGKGTWQRESYITNVGLPPQRGAPLDSFSHRLFHALDNRPAFDEVLGQVLDPLPEWTIDQSDQGQYYLKIQAGEAYHNSDGMGEGLVSLFFIVDALHDSQEGDVIVIDEPELSLHPSLQKKLSALLCHYSATRQVVYATHSPYFLNVPALFDGAQVARLSRSRSGCEVFQVETDAVDGLRGLLSNVNNPHIMGLSAREAFFLKDRILLVEGQEDVVVYGGILKQLRISVSGDFFGWGVGGAGNMRAIAVLLKQLGFHRVVGLLDADKADMLPALREKFPEYRFFAIPADDVRTKSARQARAEVKGLTDSKGTLDPQYEDDFREIVSRAEEYLVGPQCHQTPTSPLNADGNSAPLHSCR